MGSSKADIAVSYDVSNEFFRLWLDESMSYTRGIFDDSHGRGEMPPPGPAGERTPEEGQVGPRLSRLLPPRARLDPAGHVLRAADHPAQLRAPRSPERARRRLGDVRDLPGRDHAAAGGDHRGGESVLGSARSEEPPP